MHVIFDLDGTLADTHPGITDAFRAAMGEVLPGDSVPEFTRYIGPPVRQVFRNALRCEDASILDALNNSFRKHYDGHCWMNAAPYHGIPTLLEFLASNGIGCSVLTNKPSLPTSRILEHLKLRHHFLMVLSPDSVEPAFTTKSQAADHLARILNLHPDTTWMIGDSADDATAAASCGFKFAAAAYGYGGVHLDPSQYPHLVIGDIPSLQSYFKQHIRPNHE